MKKISNKSKKLLLISCICFTVSVGIGFYMFSVVSTKSLAYVERSQIEVDMQAHAESIHRLNTLIANTEEERDEVEYYFLDVVKMASLLEQIEQYAQARGLLLESSQLRRSPNNDNGDVTEVRIPYEVSGSREEVYSFIDLLEKIPYHSSIEHLRISLEDGLNQRSAEVTLVVSYMQYDNK